MHIHIDYDTIQHRRDTCWMDWVSVVLLVSVVLVYLLVALETVKRWKRGNMDISSKGLFWHMVMYVGAVGHMIVIFVSNEHFSFTRDFSRKHCELFDIWLNVICFASWYCFYAVFYVSVASKNRLRVDLPMQADVRVEHIEATFNRDSGYGGFCMESEDEEWGDVALIDSGVDSENASFANPFQDEDVAVDEWVEQSKPKCKTLCTLTPSRRRTVAKFLVCILVLLPPLVVCLVGELTDQSRYSKKAHSCMLTSEFRYILISMLLVYLLCMWGMHCFMVRKVSVPTADKQGFMWTAVLMTVTFCVVISMNLLGLLSFCIGRALYLAVFAVLYLGTLYFTVVRNFMREKAREVLFLQAIQSYTIPSTFDRLLQLESKDVQCEILSAFVYWTRSAGPCLTGRSVVFKANARLDLRCMPDLVKKIFMADTCDQPSEYFILFALDMSKLYEFILYRKNVINNPLPVDDVTMEHMNALNSSILHIIGDTNAMKTVSAVRLSKRDGVSMMQIPEALPNRGTLPFSTAWKDTLDTSSASAAFDPGLFDEVQLFLETLFGEMYYPRFLASESVKKTLLQASEAVEAVSGVAIDGGTGYGDDFEVVDIQVVSLQIMSDDDDSFEDERYFSH